MGKIKTGMIGWRGMVGSVLMQRMHQEHDFEDIDPVFFSTSQTGQPGPDGAPLQDAYDLDVLMNLPIILTCQGGSYTEAVLPKLRQQGWKGYWVDAASTMRMHQDSMIVLDPVNRKVIDQGLHEGIKNYIGGNCTVSLMLMGIHGLFDQKWVEWISTMTYQSASGGGAKHMIELVQQMGVLGEGLDPAKTALEVDQHIADILKNKKLPHDAFGVPLAANLIPWIDRPVEAGQTREEWKGFVETNKILRQDPPIPIDGQCVRVGAMRCHSQALTIKLNQDIPLNDIEAVIKESNPWVKLIPNDKDLTMEHLTPVALSGTLHIGIGRLRKMNLGPEYLTLFTVGDQLLWGAAEPVRRMLPILAETL